MQDVIPCMLVKEGDICQIECVTIYLIRKALSYLDEYRGTEWCMFFAVLDSTSTNMGLQFKWLVGFCRFVGKLTYHQMFHPVQKIRGNGKGGLILWERFFFSMHFLDTIQHY